MSRATVEYSNLFWTLPDKHVYAALGAYRQVIMVFPDLDGFKRDLDRSLQVLQTNYVDLYQLHDLSSQELTN